ncbi:MAG: hypothetical protein J5966_09720 [Lachnospiraceae bacterium]|nr:hypothetical protein [Lachnospiraceae bacterium]
MSTGNLQIGDVQKKKEDLNKTGGINTQKALFQTNSGSDRNENSPYMTRTEQLANYGPLQQTRIHIQNRNDIAMPEMRQSQEQRSKEEGASKVHSEEGNKVLKAQPDLKIFTGKAVEKGVFSPKAKEAARHFFKQVMDWAGSFEDGGSGFYREMGIDNVLDCLYVDGMSLKTYVRDQYLYKATGNPAQQQEMLRNYVALIAARGRNVITLVRPNLSGNGARVEYKNMFVDLSNLGSQDASRARRIKERGNQVRNSLKKRIDGEMTERTGMAYRKVNGIRMDGFSRIEGAGFDIKKAGEDDSPEYRSFREGFDRYNGGLQKLGLIPGRDDINMVAAREMKKRCRTALDAADGFLRSGSKNEKAVKAVQRAKKELETDMKLLDQAISTKLDEENARMKLEDLFDSRNLKPDDKGGEAKADAPDRDDGNGEE